jgi:nucleoside-diphosphate-sugar epimerase
MKVLVTGGAGFIGVNAVKRYLAGGGPANQISLLDLISGLQDLAGHEIDLRFAGWRPGGQPVFICDITGARQGFDWQPRVSVGREMELLHDWVLSHRALFAEPKISAERPVPSVLPVAA